MQLIEGIRPDVEIFDRGLYVLGLRDHLVNINSRDQIIIKGLIAKIQSQIQIRPVYATENDLLLNNYFCFIPEGIIFRVYSLDSDILNCAQDEN